MTYLLDTNILIFWLMDHKELPAGYKKILENNSSKILLSSAVLWEITIKIMIKKLRLPNKYKTIIDRAGFTELPIRHADISMLESLPNIHRDPFDRILIAQAKTEDVQVLTIDPIFTKYKVQIA